MSDDKTVDTGNWGKYRVWVVLVSQDDSNNRSRLRVRARLQNTTSVRSYNNNNTSWTISGSTSDSGTFKLDVPGGATQTVVDEYFYVSHSSDGSSGQRNVTVKLGNTGTSTFGTPGSLTVGLTPPAIPRKPVKPTLTGGIVLPQGANMVAKHGALNSGLLLGYTFRYGQTNPPTGSGTNQSGATRSYNGLSLGASYWFQVAVRTTGGTSDWSSVVRVNIPNTPLAPGGLARSFAAPNKITLTWNVADGRGAGIEEYQIQSATNSSFSGAQTITNWTNLTKVYEGLSLGTTYYYRVRARNSQGWGSWSGAVSYAVPNRPSNPAAPNLTATPPSTISVSWSAPNNGGASITGYTVQYANNSSFSGASTVNTTGTSATLTGLSPGSTYWVRVLAKNSQGNSSYGSSRSIMLNAGPRVNVSGTWRTTVAYVNVNGTWRVAIPYVNVNNTWRIAGG